MMMKKLTAIIIAVVICLFLPQTIASADTQRAVFKNTRNNESVFEVEKEVIIPEGAVLSDEDRNRSFEFTLLSENTPVRNAEYTVLRIHNGVLEVPPEEYTEENGVRYIIKHNTGNYGTFHLKVSQIARFTRLTAGTSYTVTETGNNGSFVQTFPSSGKNHTIIMGRESQRVVFKNTYEILQQEQLNIKKVVDIPTGFVFDTGEEFTFELTVGRNLYSNKSFDVINSAGDIIRTDKTDSFGVFKLKANETAHFTLSRAVDYKVREILDGTLKSAGWRILGNDYFENSTSIQSDVTFTNTNASFIVTKSLTQGETDEEFVFRLRQDNFAMAGEKYYLYNIDGTPISDLTKPPLTTADDGSFSLKANQAAYFVGIEPGTRFTVAEIARADFAVELPSTGRYVNEVVKERAVTFRFVNKPVDASGKLQVKKQ